MTQPDPAGIDEDPAEQLRNELIAELIGTLEQIPTIRPSGDDGRFDVDGRTVEASELVAVIGELVSDALACAHQLSTVTER